jgi:hypothetical protein
LPFPLVPPEVYWALPEADRAGIEQIIRDMIEKRNSKYRSTTEQLTVADRNQICF